MQDHPNPRPSARFLDVHGIRKNVLFESYEHMFIGNQIDLCLADGKPRKAAGLPFALPNGAHLTYGRIVALAGDFFGLPGQAIADDPAPPTRFLRAFQQLAQDRQGAVDVAAIGAVMEVEITAVKNALARGDTDIYKVYEGLDLNGRYNVATGGGSFVTDMFPMGRYLQLAAGNFDHFADDAIKAYRSGHDEAVRQAIRARGLAGAARDAALQLAYAMNAFADHFLSDLFSGGHIRTPRRQLYDSGMKSLGAASILLSGLCAKAMHDEDSYYGLSVRNARGDKWRAFGDKKLFDHQDEDNKMRVIAAVQASASDIWTAFTTGAAPRQVSALQLIPDLRAARDNTDRGNKPALFTVGPAGQMLRRTDVGSLSDYSWTNDWWFATTVALLKKTEHERLSGHTDSPLNIDPVVVQFFSNPKNAMGIIKYGPARNGYETTWSTFDIGQGAGNLALLDVDLDGDGNSEFVQMWQNGPNAGAIVYAPDPQSVGYEVRLASGSVLTEVTGGRWLGCRRAGSGAWIAHCSGPGGAVGIDVLRASDNGHGLDVVWRSPQVIDKEHRGRVIAADIDGDGNDELVWVGLSLGLDFSFAAAKLGEKGPQVMFTGLPFGQGEYVGVCLPADIDGSGRQSLVTTMEAAGGAGFTVTYKLDAAGKGFRKLARQDHQFSGTLLGWLVVDADQDGAADLVRVGALNGRTTIQLFRSRKDGTFDAGHANTFDVLPNAVGLLTSRVGGKGRYVVHQLFNNSGKLGWAVYTPNAEGTGFGLAGRKDDMQQGPWAIGFYTANVLVMGPG